MSEHETADDGTDVEQLIETIKNDRSKALRAEKTAGDAENVDDPRTAVRFLEERAGVPYFEVVTTTTTGFPLGRDNVSEETQEPVTSWCEQNDPEVIDVRDDDGFEFEVGELVPDGGVTEQEYDWQLRVTLNGVGFTGPGCATKQEAEALETVVRDADGVESTEVERQ